MLTPRLPDRLRRAYRELFGTRIVEAASPGRPWAGMQGLSTLNPAVTGSLNTERQRARGAYANQGLYKNAVDSWVNAVGGDFWQVKPRDAALRATILREYERWQASCGPTMAPSLNALFAMHVRSLVLEGEGIALIESGPDGMPRFRPIAPDQIDPTMHRQLAGDRRIEAGVEVAAGDAIEAYHVRKDRAGVLLPMRFDAVRVPASQVIFTYAPVEPGALRGIPWGRQAGLTTHGLDKLDTAVRTTFEVAALNSVFLTPTDGGTGPYSGTTADGRMTASMEPGAILITPPGMTIETNTPSAPQGLAEFRTGVLHQIAASWGLPYHVLTADVSRANYSSARVALIEFRRRVGALQQQVLIPSFWNRVWDAFITSAILTGRLPAADPARYAADFLPPAFAWVDPESDIKAETAAITAGLKSRSRAIAETGYDAEEVDAENAADAARAKRLGLTYGAPAAAPAPAPAQRPEKAAERTLAAPALILRRAPLVSRTLDSAARTFEATAATETLVPRRDFDGEFFERLAVTAEAIDLAAIPGIPVLDSHNRFELDATVGVVLAARLEGAALICRVKLSARDAVKPILADIADGIITAVSVGYSVETWREHSDPATGRRVKTASKWTPRELSLVSIGADPAAKIRSYE